MEKIAYLIICHKNEEQIIHLVNKLKNDDSEVFVHLDKNSDVNPEMIKK